MDRYTSHASSSRQTLDAPDLPPFAELQTWVHRPQAVAKALVSDVYNLRTLLPAEYADSSYYTREVFLLDRFPCRHVELVGWVSGVDRKESSMTIFLDDGDGSHVLPITYRLPLVFREPPRTPAAAQPATCPAHPPHPPGQFLSARERKAARRAAIAQIDHAKAQALAARTKGKMREKVYKSVDVRVGDTIRVRGKVEEWFRRKDGGGEWVRGVGVDEASGGFIEVVDPDAESRHLLAVLDLHRSMYSQPFTMPDPIFVTRSSTKPPRSPEKSMGGWSEMQSSEIGSEASLHSQAEFRLRDPTKLSSSQLTDRTFRQYVVDYMTQCVTSALEDATPHRVEEMLAGLFPEFAAELALPRQTRRHTRHSAVFGESTRWNEPVDAESTPRSFKSAKRSLAVSSLPSCSWGHAACIDPVTVASLLAVPHLSTLAALIVDAEARRDERRRRRRLKEGMPRPKDLQVEEDRRSRGLRADEWRLSDREKTAKAKRLAEWCLREMGEEGGIVHVCMGDTQTGYLPLPPQLTLPLLIPLLKQEEALRRKVFIRKTDPRFGHGMATDEVLARLRSWGEEGRWERVGRWVVEDALEWGAAVGQVRKVGKGWWACDELG